MPTDNEKKPDNRAQNARKHSLSALRQTYYNSDVERLISEARLPQQTQKLINERMAVFKQQDTYNEITAGIFKRMAFFEAWLDLAEQWFISNKLGPFWVSKDGQFVGSHLAFQYKIFSEALARGYEKLGLLPSKRKNPFLGFDFGAAMQEVTETNENDTKD